MCKLSRVKNNGSKDNNIKYFVHISMCEREAIKYEYMTQ